MKKIIVMGSRSFSAYECLKSTLDKYLSNVNERVEIIEDGMKGVSTYADENGHAHTVMVSNQASEWKKRHRDMIDYALCGNCSPTLFAFWDGKSEGTQYMINLSKNKGIETHIVIF